MKMLELLVKNVMANDMREQRKRRGSRREKAVQLRRQRAGHLGDVRKKFHAVKALLNDDTTLKQSI